MTDEETKAALNQHRDALAFHLRMLGRDVDELRAGRETEPASDGVATAIMRTHFHLNHLLLALELKPIPPDDDEAEPEPSPGGLLQ